MANDIIQTGSFIKALEPLSGLWVDEGVGRYPEEYAQIFKVVSKDRAYFEDGMYVGLNQLQEKPQSEAIKYASMRQFLVKRYLPVSYGLGVAISHEMIADGIALDVAERAFSELGEAVTETKNAVAMNVLNLAFSSSQLGADGVALCSPAHPTDGGTYSNRLSTTATLSQASIKQAYLEMKSMSTLAGAKRKVLPQKLVIPRELVFVAEEALKSVNKPDSMDNNLNSVRSLNIIPDGVVMSDWLTSTTAYFFITNKQQRGLTFFEREKLVVGRDRDSDTMNAKIMVYTRFGVGWTDAQCIFGAQGA